MAELAVSVYLNILGFTVPFAVFFALGNIIVGVIMRSAFGGKLEFR